MGPYLYKCQPDASHNQNKIVNFKRTMVVLVDKERRMPIGRKCVSALRLMVCIIEADREWHGRSATGGNKKIALLPAVPMLPCDCIPC